MPTWLTFPSIFPPFSDPWDLLGASWSLLGPSWGRLGESWAVLDHLKTSWNQKRRKKALQDKPVLAREREARLSKKEVRLWGSLRFCSELANYLCFVCFVCFVRLWYFVRFVCFMCCVCSVCFVRFVCFVICVFCVFCVFYLFCVICVCFGILRVCVSALWNHPKHFSKLMPKPPNFFNILWLFNSFKTIQNTSQNRCQNLPKSSPRRSKIEVWRGSVKNTLLSSKFSTPGGASWGVLGASWGHLGTVLGALGRLGSVLGPSWDVLGTSWDAFQCQFNFKAIFDRFLIDFWTRVGAREPQSELAG